MSKTIGDPFLFGKKPSLGRSPGVRSKSLPSGRNSFRCLEMLEKLMINPSDESPPKVE